LVQSIYGTLTIICHHYLIVELTQIRNESIYILPGIFFVRNVNKELFPSTLSLHPWFDSENMIHLHVKISKE
jgi:hypothetical protein